MALRCLADSSFHSTHLATSFRLKVKTYFCCLRRSAKLKIFLTEMYYTNVLPRDSDYKTSVSGAKMIFSVLKTKMIDPLVHQNMEFNWHARLKNRNVSFICRTFERQILFWLIFLLIRVHLILPICSEFTTKKPQTHSSHFIGFLSSIFAPSFSSTTM